MPSKIARYSRPKIARRLVTYADWMRSEGFQVWAGKAHSILLQPGATLHVNLGRCGKAHGIDAGFGGVFVLLSASSAASHRSDQLAASVNG